MNVPTKAPIKAPRYCPFGPQMAGPMTHPMKAKIRISHAIVVYRHPFPNDTGGSSLISITKGPAKRPFHLGVDSNISPILKVSEDYPKSGI